MKLRLNNKLRYSLYAVLACVLLSSCSEKQDYPIYSIKTVEYIPDSLKAEHSKWITETIRAASQHMTGGDYEDVDATIRQAKWTADELFELKVIGLRKQINENYWDDLELAPKNMSKKELMILDSLINAR